MQWNTQFSRWCDFWKWNFWLPSNLCKKREAEQCRSAQWTGSGARSHQLGLDTLQWDQEFSSHRGAATKHFDTYLFWHWLTNYLSWSCYFGSCEAPSYNHRCENFIHESNAPWYAHWLCPACWVFARRISYIFRSTAPTCSWSLPCRSSSHPWRRFQLATWFRAAWGYVCGILRGFWFCDCQWW